MKKIINLSFIYAIAALCAGVFYREFTKFTDFTGKTTLSVLHTHLFMLGMIMLLIVALCYKQFSLTMSKKFNVFLWIYNIGVAVTSIMLLIRGILQVQGTSLSTGLDASISGISGIGHILTGAGIILFFLILKGELKDSRE